MSFLNNLTAFLPFGKKEETQEYFFAINIGLEQLTAALWALKGKQLEITNIASQSFSSEDEIISVTDKLLDQVLGLKEIEPQKILFGVPNSWVLDDNLKDEYLKLLRNIVKKLELTPMAYVSVSNALVHFLEKQESVPPTAVLVGLEKLHLTVTVVRAGKIDGVKMVRRGESAGADIEKALLTFTDVETLPSKILIYGGHAAQLKGQLLSFSWMSKLAFLHLPKIEVLEDDIEVKSICLAGGSEIDENVVYSGQPSKKHQAKVNILAEEEKVSEEAEEERESPKTEETSDDAKDFGFVVGDVAEDKSSSVGSEDQHVSESAGSGAEEDSDTPTHRRAEPQEERELVIPDESPLEIEDFEQDITAPAAASKPAHKKKSILSKLIPRNFASLAIILGVLGIFALTIGAYLFLVKANIKVYVEPKILEKDATVIADPKQKSVNEADKIIPGQVIEADVSGTGKDSATGKRQIGDPAKGTVVLYNKTSGSVSLSKGTQLSGPEGLKFTLDNSVSIASQSASDSGITFGKATSSVTASAIGADGNLPSGSDFTVSGYSIDKVAAKSEGNFSGGTSKDVTVVSSEDQQRLLAKLSSDLRQQAQQKLQEKYPDKKILQEALQESITKKSYNKNVNDQAGEFSLNLTIKYKGTAFDDADLRTIVSKLVNTQVPDNFHLDISETETQADVSKLEKDGRLVFLAKFKAKLIPKVDSDKIKNQIKFKTVSDAENIIKGMENVLGSEIKITPSLPAQLARLPFFTKNIYVEVGLK